jgi:hypothetical protein
MSTQDEFTDRGPSDEKAGSLDNFPHRDELNALLAKLQDSPGLVEAGVEIIVPREEDADFELDPGVNRKSILRAAAALRRRRCWTVFPSGITICIPPR